MKKKIFVIDDDWSVISYMEVLLSCYGYGVSGFTSVDELFDEIEKTAPDLIFVDLILRQTT
ncbi:MAG: hypothetical protein Q7K21_07000, partial [Elusimicrobiota bacterium]|nr:hypothetical protein [Elusimicrobiota bacterium]